MQTRRQFLGAVGVPAAAVAAGVPILPASFSRNATDILAEIACHPGTPEEVAGDEDFWVPIQRAFTVDRSLLNLNNGGVSPSPRWVLEAQKGHIDFSNKCPTYTMWRVLEPQREGVRQRMARAWACDPEEIAFTRNASESLQTCQFGFDLEPGDEVLTTTQDYGRMLTTFRQRERREGIHLRQIQIPVPTEDFPDVVRRFQEAITPRTRMILICHMVNLTGQIMPVRDIVQMARGHGIPVIIDGAHAFAHLDFTFQDLDCEYYGTSLHKWLFAPHGTGLLYVRREKIGGLWPLMAAAERQTDNIRKFEEIGTHPAAPYLAIAEALSFHQGIGAARKEARMTYMRDYWAKRLLQRDRIRLHTSMTKGYAAGVATVQIEGIEPGALSSWLFNAHRIVVTPINHPEFQGIRVTPSVYTLPEELDRFCDAMEHAERHGLPTT
jgi:selenocysteine lyase/cysteine desulfurase